MTANEKAVAANLASLNEIIAEMTAAVSNDPEFTELVRGTLRDHSWALGFRFQGQLPPAGHPVHRADAGLQGQVEAFISTLRQEKIERNELADSMTTAGNKSYQHGFSDALDRCMQELMTMIREPA